MSWAPLSTVVGLALLVGASVLAPGGGDDSAPRDVRAAEEPLAVALTPLGPAKAVLSALLWERLQLQRRAGEVETAAPLSQALLALHPGLAVVREHLATRLILSDAAQAPDLPRYRALVLTGLSMLEEGQAFGENPRLHEALGQLLAIQGRNDPRFWEVASEYFGAPPEEIAIQELRLAGGPRLAALLLADLLLDRGFESWELDRDGYAADRDLSEAQELIEVALPGEMGFDEERSLLSERIAELRERIADESKAEGEAGSRSESRTGEVVPRQSAGGASPGDHGRGAAR